MVYIITEHPWAKAFCKHNVSSKAYHYKKTIFLKLFSNNVEKLAKNWSLEDSYINVSVIKYKGIVKKFNTVLFLFIYEP